VVFRVAKPGSSTGRPGRTIGFVCRAVQGSKLRGISQVFVGFLVVSIQAGAPRPLWRGSLLPLGCAAAPNQATRCVSRIEFAVLGLLRSPAGINPLATKGQQPPAFQIPAASASHSSGSKLPRHGLLMGSCGLDPFAEFRVETPPTGALAIVLCLGQGVAAEFQAAGHASKGFVAALLGLDGVKTWHVVDQFHIIVGQQSCLDRYLRVLLAPWRAIERRQAVADDTQHVRDPGLALIRASAWTVEHGQRLLDAAHLGQGWVGAFDAMLDGQPGLLRFADVIAKLRVQRPSLAFGDAKDNKHARQDDREGRSANFYIHRQTLLEETALYGNRAVNGRAF